MDNEIGGMDDFGAADVPAIEAAYDAFVAAPSVPGSQALCNLLLPFIVNWSKVTKRRHKVMRLSLGDLVGDATLSVLEEIDKLKTKPLKSRANIKGYFAKAILNGLNRCVESQSLITIPHETRRRKRKDGTLQEPKIRFDDERLRRISASDSASLVHAADEIEACCLDEIDRQIVQARLDDNDISQDAIAERVGIARQNVSLRLKNILDRYQERKADND